MSPVLIFMSFTGFRQSLCFSFFLQSPFITFVGSKVGVAVRARASHLCDPGSVPVVGTWVEFVVGSVLAPPFIKTNTSKFQFDLDVKCLHMSPWLGRLGDYSSHYDVKFDLPFFYFICYIHILDSLPFPINTLFTLHVWPVSLFPFT